MKKIYYEIMISSIYTAQNNGFMSDIWKFTSNFYFAFATNMYMMGFFMVLKNDFNQNYLDILNLKMINGKYNFILNMLLYFIIPIMSINYFLIFKNKKYEDLIKKYKKSYNKKFFALYFLLSFIFVFVYVFSKVESRF